MPWYNVFGNHDNNRGATENRYADETFERYFGPSTYAYEYGEVVFISLNNIFFKPEGGYQPHFLDEQLGQPLDEVLGWKMDYPSKTRHMWEAKLPAHLESGTHLVTVRTTDMFGHTWTAHRIFRIR